MATLVTPRDLQIFQALDLGPLTVAQLFKINQTFTQPFTGKHRVWERLQLLTTCGRVRRYQYATAGPGVLGYYTLSPLGYQLLHGHQTRLPHARTFSPVSVARQQHTRCLTDFLVHTIVAAHRAGLAVSQFSRENTLRLAVGQDALYPDSAFELTPSEGTGFRFFVELDNCTERVRSTLDADSWQRKLLLYDLLQDQAVSRFRVLVVTTGTEVRLTSILSLAATLTPNPNRSLVYGTTLADYLGQDAPLTAQCFVNHRREPVALIQRYGRCGLPTSVAVPAFSTTPAFT